MTVYPFSALLSRMRYIARWGLMRAARQENLAEHTAETAQLAHLLALLARDRFSAPVSPERVAVAALYHDASEILTGDLPTPVKYNNEELKTAYKALEREAEERLAALAPPEVRDGLRGALCGDGLTEREKRILKAADKLSALIKCVEERQGGNLEFESAAQAHGPARGRLFYGADAARLYPHAGRADRERKPARHHPPLSCSAKRASSSASR